MVNMREVAAEFRLSHWAEVIRERNASGMSIKAYCESIGIHVNRYFYWQSKLREAACQELLPAPVNCDEKAIAPNGWAVCDVTEVVAQANGKSSTASQRSAVNIEIGKSRVSAEADVDIELLEKVCRMLTSLC